MLRDPALIPLSRQHHNGLALCVLTERSLREDASAENVAKLARRIVDRFELEFVNHFGVEEEILFPVIRREADVAPLLDELIAEHRKLESLVDQLRAAPAVAEMLAFTALLRRHIRREESELFEETQRRLTSSTLSSLGPIIDEKTVKICL